VYPEDKSVHELFEEQVERTPDAVAVVACSLTDPERNGEQHLTYGELNRRANQLAHYLLELDVGPEVLVGICVERSLEAVLGLLGVLKAGGTYVPLDPKHPQERMAFMLTDTQTPILLTESRFLASIPNSQPSISKIVCLDRNWEFITGQSKTNLPGETAPESLAYVIYTSGSTGQPRGVLISHRDIASHCRHIQHYYKLTRADRVLQFASLSFDVSLEQILSPLTVGAGLVLADMEVWSPSDFHGKALDLALTVVDLPPAYWHWLVQDRATAQERMSNEHLRLAIIGGDVMQPKSLHLWWQTPMKDVRLINAYGPTEATITATAFEVASCPESESISRRVPIGRPLANRSIYILDGYDNPVPIGIVGQLHIGGTCLARGYLDRQGLTAERFVPDPFGEEPGARLYRTGDLARYLPDGNVEFLGRIDHQVKIRGFRIELGEIETVLVQHPAVREAVALVRENKPGEKCLVAYVVGEEGREPGLRELRDFLKEKLPGHMVPSAFVTLEALSLTPNGKVDRRALPALEGSRLEVGGEYVAPRGEAERVIAKVWQETLGLELVGVHDNFFDVGGHSLLVVQIHSRLKAVFEREFPMTDMFKYTTVATLAMFLSQTQDPVDIVQQRQERAAARRASLRQRARGRQSAERG
jgi:amino acid adenylation domain-containing protein